MINSKKIVQMVKHWQKLAASRSPRSLSRTNSDAHSDKCSPSIASSGYLFVYSYDGKRFTVPLTYLSRSLFRDLLRLSEEEFGHPTDGPIILPCDASYMEYIISLLRCGVCTDAEVAMLTSNAFGRWTMCYLPLHAQDLQQCFTLCGL